MPFHKENKKPVGTFCLGEATTVGYVLPTHNHNNLHNSILGYRHPSHQPLNVLVTS